MQKTVGMITIYRKNYGAFLQAYALQQALIRVGLDPEIIRYDYYKDRSFMGVPYVIFKREPLRFLKSVVVEIVRYREHQRRTKIFQESIEKHIKESQCYYRTYAALKKRPPSYDIYLTGSDQVFNVRLSPPALHARLLSFVKDGRKASYAASAGGREIAHEYDDLFRRELSSFERISVREEALKKYIEENYDLAAEQHIDPTLLITRDEWEQFADHSLKPQLPYIFYYRVLPQKELLRIASIVSDDLGMPIYVADGNDGFSNQLPRHNLLSPEQWVGMMLDAKYVVTNSFHGAAFAINLGKRASILVPMSGGARVSQLLEKCALSDLAGQHVMQGNTETIYRDAHNYFAQERKNANSYLFKLGKERA